MESRCFFRNVQEIQADGAFWTSVLFANWWADHSCWCRGKTPPFFCRRPRKSASVRFNCLLKKMHGIYFGRGGELDWWSVISGTEDLKNNATTETHMKKMNRGGLPNKKRIAIYMYNKWNVTRNPPKWTWRASSTRGSYGITCCKRDDNRTNKDFKIHGVPHEEVESEEESSESILSKDLWVQS